MFADSQICTLCICNNIMGLKKENTNISGLLEFDLASIEATNLSFVRPMRFDIAARVGLQNVQANFPIPECEHLLRRGQHGVAKRRDQDVPLPAMH